MTGLRELVEAARSGSDVACWALARYMIDTPDVLAAVEAHPDAMEALAAVRRLGEARVANVVKQRAHAREKSTRSLHASCDAQGAQNRATDAVCELADRLAARKEGGE